MTPSDWIRVIGFSHLLQPPFTLFLANPRGVNLRANVLASTPLAAAVLTNMGFTSIAIPTALGVWLACNAASALAPGPVRSLAFLLSAFWTWRLYRQLFVLQPLWPRASPSARYLNRLLILIFVVQGPVLGRVLCIH